MCYILCTSSRAYVVAGAQGFGGNAPDNFFCLGKCVAFSLIFRVASIFMSIVGQFFGVMT
jgi:hypothetical protein